MATDWAADVKKYVANADDAAIAGIVRYCGIALRKVDSSLVAFSDKTETDRVRNNFLKKKLALTQSDAVLDKAIAKVGEVMKADRTKNRVTVYYLLAAEFKKLDLFIKAPAAAKKAPAAKAPAKAVAVDKAAKPAAKKTAAKAVGAAAVVAGAAAATKAAAKPAAKKAVAKPAAKAAAPAKAAAAKPAAKKATPKVSTAKAAAKPQSLIDKTAAVASDAGKASTAAVVGTVAAGAAVAGAAVAAASGAAGAVKDTAAKAVDAAGDVAGAAAGAVTGAAGAAAGAVTGAAGAAADAAGAAAGAVTGAAGAAADKAAALFTGGGQASSSDEEGGGMGWLLWLLAAALILGLLWWVFGRGGDSTEAANATATEAAASLDASAPVDLASAPAEGSVAIPAGAGVTSELRDGKPVVKVYFDSGRTDVAAAFAPAAAGLKAYLDGHPGAKLAVSGYADPTGNAALNEKLSKQRAQAVQADLIKSGIPEASAELVKPASATDATVSKEAARRVEVTVQ